MTGVCMRWCCYEDPYDKQCVKIVKKNKKYVRCQRTETKYCKKDNAYYCEKHYIPSVETSDEGNNQFSIESDSESIKKNI
jgi:hypothetical protein